MKKMTKALSKKQRGVTMPEYGLILALIAVVCIIAFTNLGTAVEEKVQEAATAIGAA